MKEGQLNAFKDGVANALLDGDVDEDLKNKYCRHSYQQGYDFGLFLYEEQNNGEFNYRY
jgi:hypothetical protein|tara:strand:+ start:36 stop:212 length:177 start_codon:yes stop_codon:yes gene_type:complete